MKLLFCFRAGEEFIRKVFAAARSSIAPLKGCRRLYDRHLRLLHRHSWLFIPSFSEKRKERCLSSQTWKIFEWYLYILLSKTVLSLFLFSQSVFYGIANTLFSRAPRDIHIFMKINIQDRVLLLNLRCVSLRLICVTSYSLQL